MPLSLRPALPTAPAPPAAVLRLQNILLGGRDCKAKLADVGLAQLLEDQASSSQEGSGAGAGAGAGGEVFVGTFAWAGECWERAAGQLGAALGP